jgi:hypothetical protein
MNIQNIKEKFKKIRARVKFSDFNSITNNDPNVFRIDVVRDRKGEIFDIRTKGAIDFIIPDIQPKDRHLLLMAIIPDENSYKKDGVVKTLCGFDEREFFVAQVPGPKMSNVLTAKHALKPDLAIKSQKKHKVKTSYLNNRSNKGFKRQGEWFFIPVPDLIVDKEWILRPKGGEPIRLANTRAGNKPHRVSLKTMSILN